MVEVHVDTVSELAAVDGRSPSKAAPASSARRRPEFEPEKILSTIGGYGRAASFPEKQTIFAQGDAADSVFYIREGKVRLTVVSQAGKEATLGILSRGEFFGEGCLLGRLSRMKSATAMTDCELSAHRQESDDGSAAPGARVFRHVVANLLARNMRYEEDLVDHLFKLKRKETGSGSALLARFGKEGIPEPVIPKIARQRWRR